MTSLHFRPAERGNILVYVLLGIVLIGLLTAALRMTGDTGKDIDQERLVIRATEVQRFAAQVQAGVSTLLENGVSEADLKFAHPEGDGDYGLIATTPTQQVFSNQGGKVTFLPPPAGINDGTSWQFYGTTDIPQIGSNKADLLLVLGNVTEAFCTAINQQLGLGTTPPADDTTSTTPDCVYSALAGHKFSGTFLDPPNEMDPATFSRIPSAQGCVSCGAAYHYYYVLLSR